MFDHIQICVNNNESNDKEYYTFYSIRISQIDLQNRLI